MIFKDAVYIGIDPPSGLTAIPYAALDNELNVIAVNKGELSEVAAFVGGQKSAFVGINAPRRPNKGLMKKDKVRDALNPRPRPGRWVSFRVAEYQLFQLNIRTPKTPSKVRDCPGWMRNGFTLYKRLAEFGFQDYPADDNKCQTLEVYPHAVCTVLLKKIPFLKKTLEGRLQRQLLLHSLSVDVPDPMRIFEEVTRYKIMQGTLPLDDLYSVEELEALIAAYTAWKAATAPDEITRLGDPKEGEVVIPSRDLKPKYY